MRVVIDARPLSHPQAGGYRSYLNALVRGLAERQGDEEVLLYLDRPVPEGTLPPQFATRILSTSRIRSDFQLFAQQVRRDRPDIVHGTINYLPLLPAGQKTVLTLYDALLLRRYPWDVTVRSNPRQWLLNRYWATMMRRSAQRATRIVTISQGAADELAETLHQPLARFTPVYIGMTQPPPCPGMVRQENTVLAIAAPDPRKNIEALYTALTAHRALLPQGVPRLELVCTSAKTAARAEEALAHYGLTDIQLLRGLDDAALAEAYARATVFVWPSRREGFGLPPVEAMRAGCPVVSSNGPPMPEVLGEVPLYFDPERPDELAAALARLLADPQERARRGALGKVQAARYTCRAMAEGTAAVWREALA